MIEVALIGGLGNQMFEYAAARQLQQDFGGEILLNTYFYKYDHSGRSFALDNYILNNRVSVVDKADAIFECGLVLDRISHRLSTVTMEKLGRYFDKGISLNNPAEYIKHGSIKMLGYFQSEKYFLGIRDILRKEFGLNRSVTEKNKQIISEICGTNAVCVHVRRGDYVQKKLLTCDESYYRNAMTLAKNKLQNPIFYVFSDDFEWVRNHLKYEHIIYVDYGNEPYVDMFIMRHFKNFILSNSSFSWWAQYLSTADDKMVIAPKTWVPTDKEKREIYMTDWIVINE